MNLGYSALKYHQPRRPLVLDRLQLQQSTALSRAYSSGSVSVNGIAITRDGYRGHASAANRAGAYAAWGVLDYEPPPPKKVPDTKSEIRVDIRRAARQALPTGLRMPGYNPLYVSAAMRAVSGVQVGYEVGRTIGTVIEGIETITSALELASNMGILQPGTSMPAPVDAYWPSMYGFNMTADLLAQTRWTYPWPGMGASTLGATPPASPSPQLISQAQNGVTMTVSKATNFKSTGNYLHLWSGHQPVGHPNYPESSWMRPDPSTFAGTVAPAGNATIPGNLPAHPWPEVVTPPSIPMPLGQPLPQAFPTGYPLAQPQGLPHARPKPNPNPGTRPGTRPGSRPRGLRRTRFAQRPRPQTEIGINLKPGQAVRPTPARPRPPRRGREKEKKFKGNKAATALFWVYENVQDWTDWLNLVVAAIPTAPKEVKSGSPQEQAAWLWTHADQFQYLDGEELLAGFVGWAIDEQLGAWLGQINTSATDAIGLHGDRPTNINPGLDFMNQTQSGGSIGGMAADWIRDLI